MNVQIVDTMGGFDRLENCWNALAEKRPASFFSTFDYVQTAWRHFHGSTDRLFLLTLSDGSTVAGIAPFCIRRHKRKGIPYRVIRFISAWEGDRPGILTSGNEVAAWETIFSFLETEFRDWEVLELPEQPVRGPDGNGWDFLSRSGWYWERSPGGVDYYISLAGSWEEYLKRLDSHTRHEWRRKSRRMSSTPEGYFVEWISDPKQIPDALARFVALEQSGWKGNTGIGVAKDERHRAFYEDLLTQMAAKGQAVVCFLRSGGEDMASLFNFFQRDVIFCRHTTYSPAHTANSPGILIQAEGLRRWFEEPYREYDFLSMKGEKGSKWKADWSNGRRELVDWKGYRVRSRLLPLVAARRLKRLFGGEAEKVAAGG